jgi:hypothetical protein
MIKRPEGDLVRLVTQPDHAALSGYLAAHWGDGAFRRLGYWEESPDPEALRREIVFGIAEHDNGWWEWEADPEIDPADGLPLDFLRGSDEGGFERWKRGAARFEIPHPLASLLINRHAYWLQAARVAPIREPQFRHPLFGFRPHVSPEDSSEAAALREFLVERLAHERFLLERLASRGRAWAPAARDGTLLPAVRVLQVLDTLSLAVCGGLGEPLQLLEVPRQSWDSRVTMNVRPAAGDRVVVEPYPFDQDPLPIAVPALRVKPHAWRAAGPISLIRAEIASAAPLPRPDRGP